MIPVNLNRLRFPEEQNTDRRAEGIYIFLDGDGQRISLPLQINFLLFFNFGNPKLPCRTAQSVRRQVRNWITGNPIPIWNFCR